MLLPALQVRSQVSVPLQRRPSLQWPSLAHEG
jgi:hypothetical protein